MFVAVFCGVVWVVLFCQGLEAWFLLLQVLSTLLYGPLACLARGICLDCKDGVLWEVGECIQQVAWRSTGMVGRKEVQPDSIPQ